MKSLPLSLLLAIAASLAACASAAGAPEDMADGRVLHATDGAWSATFLMENPTKGRNPLHVELFDRDEAPLSGATVKISPWMPAHGHSSEDTTAAEAESGVYEADDVLFIMAGHWELHVEVAGERSTEHFVVPVRVAED